MDFNFMHNRVRRTRQTLATTSAFWGNGKFPLVGCSQMIA